MQSLEPTAFHHRVHLALMLFAALAAPLPAEFTARILTLYVVSFTNFCVLFDNLVMTNGVDVSAGLNAFHVVPLFVEYS